MGKWSIDERDIKASSKKIKMDLDSEESQQFGHRFTLTLPIVYEKNRGNFEDVRLVYYEKITYIDYETGEWWVIGQDQYNRSPSSRTFAPWLARYSYASRFIKDEKYKIIRGGVNFLDKHGAKVKWKDLEPYYAKSKQEKEGAKNAEATLGYLKNHGGILAITMVDPPSIGFSPKDNKGKGSKHRHIMRHIQFCINVMSGGNRLLENDLLCEQFLHMDMGKTPNTWAERFTERHEHPMRDMSRLVKLDEPHDKKLIEVKRDLISHNNGEVF